MDRVFHVFVSSTYLDLKDGRKKVSEAIAKAGYVAEGMEIFPASSQRQMDFIERVIDRCDYYVLIVAGRYGSLADDGVSYTEKEFRYARAKGIPVLAFLRTDLDKLPANLSDTDADQLARLDTFRARLTSESVVDYWSNEDELATKSLAALSQARVTHAGVGWIRADRAAAEDVLGELNTLRKQNKEMSSKLAALESKPALEGMNIAGLDEDFTFEVKFTHPRYSTSAKKTVTMPWRVILGAIGSNFRTATNSSGFKSQFSNRVCEYAGTSKEYTAVVDHEIKERILMQMEALGMMKAAAYNLKNGGSAIFHKLTSRGLHEVLAENVIVSQNTT